MRAGNNSNVEESHTGTTFNKSNEENVFKMLSRTQSEDKGLHLYFPYSIYTYLYMYIYLVR